MHVSYTGQERSRYTHLVADNTAICDIMQEVNASIHPAVQRKGWFAPTIRTMYDSFCSISSLVHKTQGMMCCQAVGLRSTLLHICAYLTNPLCSTLIWAVNLTAPCSLCVFLKICQDQQHTPDVRCNMHLTLTLFKQMWHQPCCTTVLLYFVQKLLDPSRQNLHTTQMHMLI